MCIVSVVVIGVSMGQVGSSYIILLFFDPIRLYSGQKILIHTRSDRVMGRPDPTGLRVDPTRVK
jgi:hypothetical protein